MCVCVCMCESSLQCFRQSEVCVVTHRCLHFYIKFDNTSHWKCIVLYFLRMDGWILKHKLHFVIIHTLEDNILSSMD